MGKVLDAATMSYDEREALLGERGRKLMDAFWAAMARRLVPSMPEAEAIAALKELHAKGFVKIVGDGESMSLIPCAAEVGTGGRARR
jgi:hypothetical protein